MGALDYRHAEVMRAAFKKHGVKYLFIGASGAILLGFPNTAQWADLFVDRSPENGRALVTALGELGFELTEERAAEIERGKDLVQLKNGPFDIDLIFAPTESSGLTTRGCGSSMSKASPFAISTTSSPAKRPRTPTRSRVAAPAESFSPVLLQNRKP